ncbi:GPP34 family phosphoprotein [Actinomycetes bacterium KLBMP 9797]
MRRPLADELFLVGHDAHTGKPAGHAGVLASALAGALLGELLLDGRLTLIDDRVAVQAHRPYGEKVSDAVLAEITRQGDGRPVPHWVRYLRGDVREVVARRLLAAGLVRREQPRGLAWRGPVRFPAHDPIAYAEPRRRLAAALARQQRVDAQLATLAALAGATGLDEVVAPELGRAELRERLIRVTESLPAVLRALVSGVEAAITALALTTPDP